jgi:hypothetical protein
LEDNIRMDVREMVWEVVSWMHPAQLRDSWPGPCEHSSEPWDYIKGGGFLD